MLDDDETTATGMSPCQSGKYKVSASATTQLTSYSVCEL